MKIRKVDYFFSSPISFTTNDEFRCYRTYGDDLYVLDDTYTGDIFLIFSKLKENEDTYVCIELKLEYRDTLEEEVNEIIQFERILDQIIRSKVIQKSSTPIETLIEFYLL